MRVFLTVFDLKRIQLDHEDASAIALTIVRVAFHSRRIALLRFLFTSNQDQDHNASQFQPFKSSSTIQILLVGLLIDSLECLGPWTI
jgi:hypothetical protein